MKIDNSNGLLNIPEYIFKLTDLIDLEMCNKKRN